MKKLIPVLILACFAFVTVFAMGGCENPTDTFKSLSERCMTKDEADYKAAIQDRFQHGFNTWNKGYSAWLEWCDELYDENAYYNVYGHRMTLDQYKRMMGALFEQFEIMLGGLGEDAGDIEKVLIDPEKGMGSIQYAVSFKRKTEDEWVTINTMEFVQWRPDEEFGARVMEGWALSDTEIEADPEVMGFYMNPETTWDAIKARVATWE